ncbi:MAG: hypothetical protein AAFY72_08955, partial [Cyanobacteria bacterium J06649_4]
PMSIYSAAIIGVSPAGCAAAISLARQGLKVLLIDVAEFSSDLPFEEPSPGKELRPWLYPRCTWPGCRALRSLCHQSLMAVAQAQGVEVWKACRVEAAILEQGQLMGLTTERGTVRAYHILDASGQRQWLSQQLGISVKQSSSMRMTQSTHMGWQMRDYFAGPGWFLLGDAAASRESATSYGLLKAVIYRLRAAMSGLQAARAIADCEHGKISETLAAQHYSQWLQTYFIRSSVEQYNTERDYAAVLQPFPCSFS